MLASDYLGPYIDHVLSLFPFGSGSFTRYAHRGWDIRDRAKTFLELGDAFILVTTGKNWLYICNAETLTELLQRRSEFSRPLEIMGKYDGFIFYSLDRVANESVAVAVLDVFGPNLSTACNPCSLYQFQWANRTPKVEGKDWQRHRKATGPPFGEPNMSLVWIECNRQAKEMLHYWKGVPDIRHAVKDVRRFSLHVLSATGFGKSYSFDRAAEEVQQPGSLTYKESLSHPRKCDPYHASGPKTPHGNPAAVPPQTLVSYWPGDEHLQVAYR